MKMLIEVMQEIEVEVPDSLFTDQFMSDFRESFYPFDDPRDHFKHLAQLRARGLATEDSFVEGYGVASSLGIKFKIVGQSESVLQEAI